MSETFAHRPWKNFSIWRGRLPHWRADAVTYYVTFRHRRDLSDEEIAIVFREFLKLHDRKWDLTVLSVLPLSTEFILKLSDGTASPKNELSKMVERAKTVAGKRIIGKSLERFPPFYMESFDRILRNEAEFTEKLEAIIQTAAEEVCSKASEPYPFLWIADTPTFSDGPE